MIRSGLMVAGALDRLHRILLFNKHLRGQTNTNRHINALRGQAGLLG